MTIAKVLVIAAFMALFTFGPLLAVLLISRPTISSFGRRHVRAIYLSLSLINILLYAVMWFLHPRDSGRLEGS